MASRDDTTGPQSPADKAWATRRAEDPDAGRKAANKAVETTRERHGPNAYKRMGKKAAATKKWKPREEPGSPGDTEYEGKVLAALDDLSQKADTCLRVASVLFNPEGTTFTLDWKSKKIQGVVAAQNRGWTFAGDEAHEEIGKAAGSYISRAASVLAGVADPGPDRRQNGGDLANRLLYPREEVRTIIDLLDDKRQVIFHGPPGTGKTYAARELARFLAASEERVTLVQFHPSYAYEDFVQGYRPTLTEEGQAGFELRDGPLLTAARAARDAPKSPHFLIIDEINRGNLAKVFGELYFLLEYRDEDMRLQYASAEGEPFSLPENLYIIGTMNTADRSIALVDLALRRRFHFVEFHPDKPPIKGLLGRWLERNAPDMAWVADVMKRANSKLNDRQAAIGPSYFLKEDLDEEKVRLIWEHNVLPYVEEHLYGETDRLAEFDLDKLRRVAGVRTDQAAGSDPNASEAAGNGDAEGNEEDGSTRDAES